MTKQTNVHELKHNRDVVALEFFNIPNISITSIMNRVFPSIVKSFTDFSGTFSANSEPIQISGKQKDYYKVITKHKYTDLLPILIFVPEGMCDTYINYAIDIKTAVEYVLSVEDSLNQFSTYIAILLTNTESQLNTKDESRKYASGEKIRIGINQSLGSHFNNGSTKAEVKYGDVVKRNADWEDIFAYSNEMSEKMNSVNRKKLNDKVKELSDMLEKLMAKYKRNELDNISPEVFKTIAEGTYQIAADLEFFATTYYRVDAFSNSVEKSAKHLAAILND